MPNNGRSRYSAFERAQLKVLTKAAAMVMAPAATRTVYEQFVMTVHEATYLHTKLRRITFRAPEFTGFVPTGPDEYFGLLMAPPGRGLTMPSADRFNVRQAIRKLPEGRRPDLRWYTIRALRPAAGEIDVDFVLHGDAGPGSRWASAAEPGDEAGFRAGNATYRPPADGGDHLLAADETALPALSAILEAHGAGPARLRAFVELPDETYRVPSTPRSTSPGCTAVTASRDPRCCPRSATPDCPHRTTRGCAASPRSPRGCAATWSATARSTAGGSCSPATGSWARPACDHWRRTEKPLQPSNSTSPLSTFMSGSTGLVTTRSTIW